MRSQSLLLRILTVAVAIASVPLGASSATEIGRVGVESYGNGDDLRADVPVETQWTATSLAKAKIAHSRAVKSFQDQLATISIEGVVRINKVFEPKGRIAKSWAKYLPDLRKFRLVGVDAFGNTLARSPIFPRKGETIATLVVGIAEENCRVGDFGVWNFSTWFLNECSVSKGSTRDYLRIATREAHLLVDQTELTTDIQFYWMQLEGCLTLGYKFTVEDEIFDCPQNQKGFGAHRFSLRSRTGMGGYEFKISPTKRQATIRYLSPDYAEFAEGVATVKGTSKLKFRHPLTLEDGIVP